MTDTPEPQTCTNHPEAAVAGHCGFCGKPICRDCVKQLGYYCSSGCLQATRMGVSSKERESAEENKAMFATMAKVFKILALLVLLAVVLGSGWFAWRFFFSPVGRISWEIAQEGNLDSIEVIGQQDGRIYVRNPKGIRILDVATGDEIGSLANADASLVNRLVTTGSGFLAIAPRKIIFMNADGKTTGTFQLEGWNSRVELNDDFSQAVYLSSIPIEEPPREDQAQKDATDEEDDDDDDFRRSRLILAAVDVKAARELWRKDFDQTIQVSDLKIGDNLVLALCSRYDRQRDRNSSLLVAYDRRTGERRWTRPLSERSYAEIVYRQGLILIQDADRLIALNEAGEVAWALDDTQEDGNFDWFFRDGLLFIQQDGGSMCYSFKSGKPMWRTNLEFGSGDVFLVDDYLFVHGSISRTKEINVQDMPGFNQHQDIVADFGLSNMAVDESIPVLMCLERDSGELRWQQEHVTGDLFCDGQRLILFMNTAETSRLSILKDDADTVVRQYDPRSGDRIIDKTLEGIGMATPILAGPYLVGVKFNQAEAIGKARPSMAEAMGGAKPIPVDSQGIIAFRLK